MTRVEPLRPAFSAPRAQRPQRERDPRVRRSLAAAGGAAALAVALGLGVVALRVEHVQLAYRLDGLHAERERTGRMIRELEIEIATLRAPGRLESRARQLGMAPPVRDQVRLAREYVPAPSGTAAAARVVDREALVR
jgi:cell division protein FtsL